MIHKIVYHNTSLIHFSAAKLNAYRYCLGKPMREKYIRQYKVRLIRPDGSTILARCSEPREVVQLPLDIRLLNEHDKRMRLAQRKTKTQVIEEEEIEDNFDYTKYATSLQNTASK